VSKLRRDLDGILKRNKESLAKDFI